MPWIAPFKGLRYNLKKIRSLEKVVTPPYDIISPQGQDQYYRRHRWNFVRVVFGKSHPTDTKKRNRYTRARQALDQWIASGILKPDPEPSYYPYLQRYALQGRRHERWGLVALVRLDSPRIYPHEQTREGPKQDRIHLLKATEASLRPTFGLLPDPQRRFRALLIRMTKGRRPVAAVRIDSAEHLLWRVGASAGTKKLETLLRPKELVIADGHHRFEAALAYRDARRAGDPSYTPKAPYNFAMFYISAAGSKEPGLLPTHRMVGKIAPGLLQEFLDSGKQKGWVSSVGNLSVLVRQLQRLKEQGRLGIGLVTQEGQGYLLEANNGIHYQFDVEWLHQELLPRWFPKGFQVGYTQDLEGARRQLLRKEAQALFVVQPPRLNEVFRRARRLIRMPAKTTYFYPKPLAGLVEYRFHGDLR